MTEEVIKEVIITSTPAPVAPSREDQPMNSSDTTTDDSNSVPPDVKRKEKPVPHYLRASTGSCHHNCKFGTPHSPDDGSKKHWPVLRAQLRRASSGDRGTNKVEIILPKGARQSKDQKLKISHVKDGKLNATAPAKPEPTHSEAQQETVVPDLQAEAFEPGNLRTDAECFVVSHDDVEDFGDGDSADGVESIELEMPLAIQDSDASDENVEDGILASKNVCKDGAESLAHQSANNRSNSEVGNTLNLTAPAKHEQAGPRTKSKSLDGNKPIRTKEKAVSSETRTITSTQKSRTLNPKTAVADSERSSEPKSQRARAKASVTTTAASFTGQKKISPTVTSAVPKVKEIRSPVSSSNATDPSAKPATLAKLKVSIAKNAPSPSLSSEKHETDGKMTVNKNVAKTAQVVQKQREEKVIQRPQKLSGSIVNVPAKSISSVKIRTVKKERIASPIKSSRKKVSETENSAADTKGSLKPSTLKVAKAEVKDKESPPCKEKPDTPTPRTRTPRISKAGPTPSITTTQPPRKLTFRRGKVLNPDDYSSTPTRRLRFRTATAAAASTTLRNTGGRVVNKGRSVAVGAARDASTSSQVVVVLRRRHGGGDGKKRQQQVLLNNVIEETASRLIAEARKKSKVRALVGAFETVISLQEGGKAGPPAAAATASTVPQ